MYARNDRRTSELPCFSDKIFNILCVACILLSSLGSAISQNKSRRAESTFEADTVISMWVSYKSNGGQGAVSI